MQEFLLFQFLQLFLVNTDLFNTFLEIRLYVNLLRHTQKPLEGNNASYVVLIIVVDLLSAFKLLLAVRPESYMQDRWLRG